MKTILTVDDTVENLDILAGLLEDYDVIDATGGEEALAIVKEEHVDLILLDIMMPEMDGFEVCARLKADPKTRDIPVIFITAINDEDQIEKAYNIGGSDYVTKPFRPKELLARIRRELKLRELQSELERLASTDPLTMLYNRRYFAGIAEKIQNISKREGTPLSLLMFDIDCFKRVNDTYGHAVGDAVITALSQTLRDNARESDVACRYGGEEFVVLLPDTAIEGARTVAEKIRGEIEAIEQEGLPHFTVSIGVARVHPDEANLEAALKRADDALYTAKEGGRNQVVVNDG